jgi:hypothetical protein
MAEELQRPTSVSVIGGLNIGLGLLEVCGIPLFLLRWWAGSMPPGIHPWVPSLAPYWIAIFIVQFLAALLRLVSGYGLLRLERWARRAALVCAAWGVIGWGVVLALILLSGGPEVNPETGIWYLRGLVPPVVPALFIFFLTRPAAVNACTRRFSPSSTWIP